MPSAAGASLWTNQSNTRPHYHITRIILDTTHQASVQLFALIYSGKVLARNSAASADPLLSTQVSDGHASGWNSISGYEALASSHSK